MAVRFASLRTKPTLKLAFKGLIFALLVLFVNEYAGSAFAALIFIAVALFLYGNPRLNSLKFGASFAALVISPFVLPDLPIGTVATAFALGFVFMSLLGIKNLVFLKRDRWYFFVHISLLVIWGMALLQRPLSFLSEAGAFILFFLLFREFYRAMSALQGSRLALSVALQSFIAVELIGILFLLPIGFIPEAALFTLTLAVFSDVFLHHLNGRLSRRLILRDGTILILSSLIIMALSSWSL